MSNVRVRFAPSPTGSLHIGGARTALYNWLFAQHHGGTFILRIEDTDVERNRQELSQQIVEALSWLGLTWDEGPIFQSARMDLYREAAQKLLASGAAYRAFETPEELEAERKAAEASGRTYRYSGTSRDLSKGESDARAVQGRPFVLRLRMPEEPIVVTDAVQGRAEFLPESLDDFILVRSDGHPLYHFSVCVDDVAMGITHVIRGVDHLPNTPKHVALFRAMGAPPPIFAHLGMILGPDGKKLSKRHGAAGVEEFRAEGVLPEALVNFLALLGWSPGKDRERMTVTEMVELFSLDRLGASPSRFDHEKLLWMNGEYLRGLNPGRLLELLRAFPLPERDDAFLRDAAARHQSRSRTLAELARSLAIYGDDPESFDPQSVKKTAAEPGLLRRLEAFSQLLETVHDFRHDALEKAARAFAAAEGTSLGKIAQPIRFAVTATTATPPLFDVMELLGKDACLRRLRSFLRRLTAAESEELAGGQGFEPR